MTLNLGKCVRAASHLLGGSIHDFETGERLGKAFVIAFRGRFHVIGYTGDKPLRMVPVANRGLRYWHSALAFRAAAEPDYPSLRRATGRAPAETPNTLRTHDEPAEDAPATFGK